MKELSSFDRPLARIHQVHVASPIHYKMSAIKLLYQLDSAIYLGCQPLQFLPFNARHINTAILAL
jgi:hypothetical protein